MTNVKAILAKMAEFVSTLLVDLAVYVKEGSMDLSVKPVCKYNYQISLMNRCLFCRIIPFLGISIANRHGNIRPSFVFARFASIADGRISSTKSQTCVNEFRQGKIIRWCNRAKITRG